MKYLFLLFCLSLTACSLGPCLEEDEVVTVGQCAYSKYGSYGDSECVALTKKGYKVTSSQPYVAGERVCVKR